MTAGGDHAFEGAVLGCERLDDALVVEDRDQRDGRVAVAGALERVWKLSECWIDYSRRRVFPGGCFFQKVSQEYAARGGAVHDALVGVHREWMDLMEDVVREAVERGELDADPAQLAFDLNAYYEAANLASILHDNQAGYDQARQSIRTRLESATGSKLPW